MGTGPPTAATGPVRKIVNRVSKPVPSGDFAGFVSLCETVGKAAIALAVRPAVLRFRLLDRLRGLSQPRTATCRRVRISPNVQLQHHPTGGVSLAGLHTCGSVWACPVCAGRIYAERALEVSQTVRMWQVVGKTYMLTLTIRHGIGDDLRQMRVRMALAWRYFNQGRDAIERRNRYGIKHQIRALEVTHGEENGYHPHLHVLLLTDRRLDEFHESEIAEAWRQAVWRAFGGTNIPNTEHGVKLTQTLDDEGKGRTDYVAKLGLEIAAITSKRGLLGSRTPWQIAEDAANGQANGHDAKLWQGYAVAMKGARQLTWSRGTKRFFGLVEREDDELASDGVPVVEGVGGVLAEWSGREWDAGCWRSRTWTADVVAAALAEFKFDALSKLGGVKATSPPGLVFGSPCEVSGITSDV